MIGEWSQASSLQLYLPALTVGIQYFTNIPGEVVYMYQSILLFIEDVSMLFKKPVQYCIDVRPATGFEQGLLY